MKQKTFSTLPNKEQALLIGFLTPENMIGERNVSFEELAALAETAGLETVLKTEIKLRDINPATYIGAGKVKELAELGAEFPELHLYIFDTELSNAQHKNLEDALQAKIMDRTGLILEIFAQRARTKEGKLQVECAQLSYLLPRLTGLWSHLSRQYAGAGTKGPGETQLELDKRKARARLQRLREELADIRSNRELQRKA
ncbi:GTPase HflX, partial [bacterium]|nr:GTPase HflX [bacterium]